MCELYPRSYWDGIEYYKYSLTHSIYYDAVVIKLLSQPSASTFLPLSKAESKYSIPGNARWADYSTTLNKLGIPEEKVNFYLIGVLSPFMYPALHP
jgi:hypothetical protein